MSANYLWTPTRVKNFMRELEMKATKWDENIVALAEKGSISVEEFLNTDPITFGEKFWGKHDWKYTRGYSKVQKILGDRVYCEMGYYYQRTPAQVAAQAFMDAKVAAIKEQKALGLTTYMGVPAEDKAGWECVFAENKGAKAAAVKEARVAAEAVKAHEQLKRDVDVAAEQEAREAAHAAEKATRYDAAVEADERYYAGRTHEQVVADEEAAAEEKRAAKWPSVTAQEMIKMMEENPETTAAEALEVIWAGRAMKVAAEGRWEGKLRRAVIEEQRYYDEKRAARGPSATLEDIKRIVGDRTDMTGREVLEIFAKEWQEKQAEEEAHNNWMFERFRDAVKLNDEESVHVPVVQEATPLEAARETYDKTNTEFEEVYERTKSGVGTWEDVNEAYSKLDEAAMNLAQEENKSPQDDQALIKKLEEHFLETTAHKCLSLFDSVKLKVRLADKVLENYANEIGMYEYILKDNTPEQRQKSIDDAVKGVKLWKAMAEKELAELETQYAVVESVWECPTCTACWRTGS